MMTDTKFDLIVVGGGVLGTFHAYHALNQNLNVALVEKNSQPVDATVRNFGQVVPSGMNSKWQRLGRESLEIYKSIQQQFDISVREEGSIYLASNQEEEGLLEELSQINRDNEYESQLLTQADCLQRLPGLRSDYCTMGLYFPQEINVHPTIMIHRLHQYMVESMGLSFFNNTTITEIQETGRQVRLISNGQVRLLADQVIICSGSDFRTLYADLFRDSDLELVKLQMMATVPQKDYRLPGSILTGLSIRRYESFQECPSYQRVKSGEDPNSLEKKYSVHILFKQSPDGSVIIGDSHLYASVANIDQLGFELDMNIDRFIVQEAKKIIDLPEYRIQRRWAGFYCQCKTTDIFHHPVSEKVLIVTGIGGKGMTGSAGYAKENINKILNTNNYA